MSLTSESLHPKSGRVCQEGRGKQELILHTSKQSGGESQLMSC